jgi:CheY-like chemotaxis protein
VSMRLMIVDDEKPILRLLSSFIEMSGNEAFPVTNSKEAATLIEHVAFDAFIFDVQMTPPDGFDLTRATRRSALNRNAPIVLITGDDNGEIMRQGFNAGATCFLGKPIARDKIQNLMNTLHGPVSSDRRCRVRVPFNAPVECRWGTFGNKHMIAASLNIGEGGMSIEPTGGITVGEELTMDFSIAQHFSKLHFRAKVDHMESAGRLAVEFLETSVRNREAIQDYITARPQG